MEETQSAFWEKLTESAADALLEAAKGRLVEATLNFLISFFYREASKELQALVKLQQDMDCLVRGPYNAGLTWLDTATAPHRNSEERIEFIKKARDKFVDAQAQEPNSYRRALAERQLGLCWLLLGSVPDARHWLEKAHRSAQDATIAVFENRMKAEGRTKAIYGLKVILLTLMTLGAYVIYSIISSERKLIKALGPTRALLAFLDDLRVHVSLLDLHFVADRKVEYVHLMGSPGWVFIFNAKGKALTKMESELREWLDPLGAIN